MDRRTERCRRGRLTGLRATRNPSWAARLRCGVTDGRVPPDPRPGGPDRDGQRW
ncbi:MULTISPECIES: hypothetical protein [Rhodococcus]|uniref:Uncharacterized protein n=1 Tax=Rhodococcus indonesiensis TaxID=3055869 RepID=A0ABT7RR85_9NOCA|nr:MULTISPECIES: hypothetical protein [Rhodococcus]MDM7490159.1 hypothetical protein [Rhodococcus indonesiensis]